MIPSPAPGYSSLYLDVGDRIRSVLMIDDSNPIARGSEGTVVAIMTHSDWFQVDVDWDNGRKLMLVVPPERFELVD